MMWKGIVNYYREFLPVDEDFPQCSLQEGNTPLYYAGEISNRVGAEVYLKFEGLNPTGSFKDRGMVMAVTKAIEDGSDTIMCASTGNTSASAAAYAAKNGLTCAVLVPHGNIAMGKLSQALMHGAKIIEIEGNFDEALTIVRDITSKHPISLVNSLNPYRLEGQKTAAFEVCDQLQSAPNYLAIPVGNAGNITAYWKGFQEYRDYNMIENLPRMLGFQAQGAAPILSGEPVQKPETLATAIRIGNPASWQGALTAVEQSKGEVGSVSDQEIIHAYQTLAKYEGVFVEPASAASVAGIMKLGQQGWFKPEDKIVCVNTGHGLKDPDCAINSMEYQPQVIPPLEDQVLDAVYS
ncbi:threonine synthase [Natranaerobius thermophilus]